VPAGEERVVDDDECECEWEGEEGWWVILEREREREREKLVANVAKYRSYVDAHAELVPRNTRNLNADQI